MAAPAAINDAIESVLDIFFSDIRHRERAVFILCDNLVEMACKTKAKQQDYQFNIQCNFYEAWNAPGVGLSPRSLGNRVQDRRDIRNLMQHASAAVTVDMQACADAICDVIMVIDHCWHNSSTNLRFWQKVALRIVTLYSSDGDSLKHQEFEDMMRSETWRSVSEKRHPRINEVIIEAGLRKHWTLVTRHNPAQVEALLNRCSIP